MTKQELEARVAELEAQLAGTGVTGVVTVPAGLSDAEVDAKIAEVKAAYETQLAGIQQAREEDDAAHNSSLSKLRKENMELITTVDQVSAELQKKISAPATGEGVVLGGVKHSILKKERMLDLVDEWRKKEIADDALVLVIQPA